MNSGITQVLQWEVNGQQFKSIVRLDKSTGNALETLIPIKKNKRKNNRG